jgi:XRE family transcriptional regulator, regulator of sulfur utilization
MPSIFSAEKLTALRKLKGYSQEKLAEKAGINIRSLQRLEKNEVQPQPHILKILADALEVAIDDFMTIPKDEMPSQIPALLHFQVYRVRLYH